LKILDKLLRKKKEDKTVQGLKEKCRKCGRRDATGKDCLCDLCRSTLNIDKILKERQSRG